MACVYARPQRHILWVRCQTSRAATSLFGCHPEVSPVRDGQQRRSDESANRPVTEREHVFDHRSGRGDFLVAVVPREFDNIEEI